MFYVRQDFGRTTANISCCSGAAAEAGNCAAEAHIACIIAHSFNGFNGIFDLAKATLRNPPRAPGPQVLRLAAGSFGQQLGAGDSASARQGI